VAFFIGADICRERQHLRDFIIDGRLCAQCVEDRGDVVFLEEADGGYAGGAGFEA
jgi:hypothetical protein